MEEWVQFLLGEILLFQRGVVSFLVIRIIPSDQKAVALRYDPCEI